MQNNAREYAIRAHGTQKYGDHPYAYHLDRVAAVLREFEYGDNELLTAAYLHDIIEDTPVTWEDLAHDFGFEVADIVFALTDERGKTRAERHVKTYPKIKANSKALIVKLADRIANVRECIETNNIMLDAYKSEHKKFREALYTPETESFWITLDYLLETKQ